MITSIIPVVQITSPSHKNISFFHRHKSLCVSLLTQGVWGGDFPHIGPQYVHPVCSEGALRLCHVCTHPAGLSGGRRKQTS